jgi:hypothetical protein
MSDQQQVGVGDAYDVGVGALTAYTAELKLRPPEVRVNNQIRLQSDPPVGGYLIHLLVDIVMF